MMKRLFFLLTALLTLSVGMWAQTQSVTYIDENGVEQTVYNVNVITNSSLQVTWGEAGQTTWYVVVNDVLISQGVICQGNVHLILADDAKLTATGGGDHQAGIQVSGEDNSLSIYGQDAQSGRLIATGGEYGSGIGGGDNGIGSNITINGGTVSANGGNYGGAGIGGGYVGSGSNITINSGTVTATGGKYGSGIGGGMYGSGSNITINGGTVTATGGEAAAGIGGGGGGSGSNITIKGGDVTATGGEYGSGIGGGFDSSGSNITIKGGDVTATGGRYGSGIGGGQYGSGSNITINGGTVTATGGEAAAGIGGGYDASGSDIFMPDNYRIKADGTFIHNDGTDLADSLAGKRNVEAYPDELLDERDTAFAAISAAVESIPDETILAMAAAAMEAVFQAEGSGDIEASKQKALDDLQYVISFYNSGKAAALGSMGKPCDGCPAVEISDDNTTIKLYNPKKVEFMKNQSEK